MKNRNIALDVIRCLACLLVLVIHSPIAVHGESGFLFSSMSLIGSPCIGLFFMVSGYLLLPTEMSLFPFLKKRMGRVLIPTFFWTAFYLLVALVTSGSYAGQPWAKTLLSIPFTRQGCGFLWFMYCLTGLYIIAPIISHWVANASKKEIQFILVVWLVTTSYSLLRPFVYITEDTFGMLYYYTGYAGYFLLGAYIKRFKPQISYVLLAALYFMPFGIALFAKVRNIEFLVNSFGYLCLMTVLQTYALFMFVLKVVPPIGLKTSIATRGIVCLSNCSFGIYLVHRFVYDNLINGSAIFATLTIALQLLLSFFAAGLISWCLIYAISNIPGSEYIVGFKKLERNDT